jgi:polyhydroxybutyrate depolymerase
VLRPASSVGGQRKPLVVDLHGFTSDGDQQRLISGWDAIATTNGFIVAWPDGLDNSWNGGTCCGTAVTNDVDDVGFIRAMVAAIRANANVDAGRIYVTGLSNGGAMSQRMACEAADLFAAAAPMAFPVPYVDFANECTPSESIPVLSFMGLTDTLVPYSGAAPSFAGWRDKNGCDSAGIAPEVSEIYGGSDCSIDTSCTEVGVEVGLCSVTGSTFDPPLDVFNGHLLYFNDDAFDISERAWDFMQVHQTSAPPLPLLGAPVLVGVALAAAGGILLRRGRK